MTRTPLDVGAVVGFSRSSWSRLSCIFRSSQSASERNHCSACARGNWAPTTGSVFANPVSILCRSLGNNRPSTYRRNPSRWLLLPNNASKCFTYSSNGAGARATSIRFVNFFSASSALILPSFSPRPQTTGSGSLWTREISLDLWVCVKYILINLSSDYHYLMGLRRDTIPSPQTTGSDRTGYKSQHMGELSKIEGLRK